jgi:hypothetical protein
VADEDQPTAGPDEPERRLHGRAAATRVEDQRGQGAAGAVPDLVLEDVADGQRRQPGLGGERRPFGGHVRDQHVPHPAPGGLGQREADRPGAEDQRGVARVGSAAGDGVPPDAQGLDQHELVEAQTGAADQLRRGHEHPLAQPARSGDPEHLDAFAAVGPAPTARAAPPAGQVGQDRAAVPDLHLLDPGTDPQHLHRQLVTQHARVGDEVLVTAISVVVGAADPDPAHGDEDLSRSGVRFLRPVDEVETARSGEHDRLHQLSPTRARRPRRPRAGFTGRS